MTVVWGNEGRGKECCGGSAKLLKFRINLSPGNSAHLLSLPSTKCCGTAEYKVSNYFTSSCWKKYNWLQGKVNTQVKQKMESLLPRRIPCFHVRMLKVLLLHNHLVFKTRDMRKRNCSSTDACTILLLDCPACASNCWGVRLVLCIHLTLCLFLTLFFILTTSKLQSDILNYDTNALGLTFKT